MEALIVAHNRNQDQYYSRNQSYSSTKSGAFGSPPSSNFRGINCRTFQTGEGLLPNPSKHCSTKTPIAENTFLASFSPKTPSTPLNGNQKTSKEFSKIKSNNNKRDFFSERWAGPTYSYSPPPSSLPIPKFSMNPKRTVSLDLPTVALDFDMHPIAKSAPASPTRERSLSPCGPFDVYDSGSETSLSPCDSLDLSDYAAENRFSSCDHFEIAISATLTLRRILNLESTD
ncbi:hypothetical protein CASFOL_008831 [Castilleja foliolosa]|uniref:Uncharacterized protein n=1 Tax=Castilleja foliolosa TaxID=1961234 RepID=A0ABD3E035_9LAMI